MALGEAPGTFAALKVLDLATCRYSRLQRVPSPSNFASLVTLTLTCTKQATILVPQTYWDETIALLRNLPNLTNLRIRDWNRAISIAPGLSPSLRTLELRTWLIPGGPPLQDDHIHQLADICPNLENLTIEVRRSRGDAAEVARYRSLGRLPRLQVLDLCLDASPPPCGDLTTAIESWFDEEDTKYLRRPFQTKYRQGHVYDVFFNSAIDDALARSIFEVIDSSKPRYSGGASPMPLERLDLHSWGGAAFPNGSSFKSETPLDHLLAALKQVWLVERDARDGGQRKLRVDEVYWNANKSFIRKMHFDHVEEHDYWFGLWRRVWPAGREEVDWWDAWKSRPLALEAN